MSPRSSMEGGRSSNGDDFPVQEVLNESNASIWTSASSITCSVLSHDSSFSSLGSYRLSFGDTPQSSKRLNSQRWGDSSGGLTGGREGGASSIGSPPPPPPPSRTPTSMLNRPPKTDGGCCKIPTRRLSSDSSKLLLQLPYEKSIIEESDEEEKNELPRKQVTQMQSSQSTTKKNSNSKNSRNGNGKALKAWELREQWKQTGVDSIPKAPRRRSFHEDDEEEFSIPSAFRDLSKGSNHTTTSNSSSKSKISRWDPSSYASPSMSTASNRKAIRKGVKGGSASGGSGSKSSNSTSRTTSNRRKRSSLSSKERKERLQTSAASAAAASGTTKSSTSKNDKSTSVDESGEHFIPKRYVPKKLLRKRSTDRRRRRTVIDDALACILEDPDKEGQVSPVSENGKGKTSYSCPALIINSSSSHSKATTSTTDLTATAAGAEESERSLVTLDSNEMMLVVKRPMSCEDPSQWVSIEKELNVSISNTNTDANATNLNDSISGACWSGVGTRNLLGAD